MRKAGERVGQGVVNQLARRSSLVPEVASGALGTHVPTTVVGGPSTARPQGPLSSRPADSSNQAVGKNPGPRSNSLMTHSRRNSVMDGLSTISSPSTWSQSMSMSTSALSASQSSLPTRDSREGEAPEEIKEVLVGVGCASAYHVNAMHEDPAALADRLDKTVIIGKENAWAPTSRGPGQMNHQNELLQPWGEHAPPFDHRYTDRTQIATEMKAEIDKVRKTDDRPGATVIEDHVSQIKRGRDKKYRVSTEGGSTSVTRKVVAATGPGPHIDPLEINTLVKAGQSRLLTKAQKKVQNIVIPDPEAVRPQVLNIDQFSREVGANPEKFRGKTIAVHGANAAWTAAEWAGDLEANLHWLVRPGAPKPHFPDGNQLRHAPRLVNDLKEVETLKIEAGADGQLKLSGQSPTGDTALTADYYVYAFGQDPDAKGGPRQILGDLSKKLTPVYDEDMRYSDKPWKTVVALRDKGATDDKGLTVVGAALNSLVPSVKHNYVKKEAAALCDELEKLGVPGDTLELLENAINHKMEDSGELSESSRRRRSPADGGRSRLNAVLDALPPEVSEAKKGALRGHLARILEAKADLGNEKNVTQEYLNQALNEVASVSLGGQLAMVRGSMAVIHKLIPPYINLGEANFSADDRTMLATYVAHNHQDVSPRFAEAFVDEVRTIRRMTQNELRLSLGDQIIAGWDAFKGDGKGSAADYLSRIGVENHGKLAEILDAGIAPGGIGAEDHAKMTQTAEGTAIDSALVGAYLKDTSSLPGKSNEDRVRLQVANALNLEGIPVLGVPEVVRERYAGVLADAGNSRSAAAQQILSGWNEFRSAGRGSAAEFLESIGLAHEGVLEETEKPLAALLEAGFDGLFESKRANSTPEDRAKMQAWTPEEKDAWVATFVTDALHLDGQGTPRMSEGDRGKYAQVVAHMQGEGPGLPMLASWLSRTGENASVVPDHLTELPRSAPSTSS